jgi:hypothetical protein
MPTINTEGMKCDVCGNPEVVGVASSPFGPMSNAYCLTCLQKRAEPRSVFEYLYAEIHPNVAPWVFMYCTYINGEYIPWTEFVGKKERGELDA